MSDVAKEVVDRLEEAGPSVAVAMNFSLNNYFDVLRGLVDNFALSKGLDVIYIDSSIPYSSLSSAFRALDVDMGHVHFIDCVSRMIMGKIERDGKVAYVESPLMLENILLKVEYLCRKLGDCRKLVILDSINSLSIHNDVKMLSEFLQILLSQLGAKGAYPVILSISEQGRAEVSEVLGLVCDQVVEIGAEVPITPEI